MAQIAASPQGLAFGAIAAHLQAQGVASVPDRTLRRRLTAPVKDGRIRKEGVSRDVRYFPPQARGSDPVDTGIPLSPEGQSIRDAVRKPLSARALAGYDAGMLLDYVPGKT